MDIDKIGELELPELELMLAEYEARWSLSEAAYHRIKAQIKYRRQQARSLDSRFAPSENRSNRRH